MFGNNVTMQDVLGDTETAIKVKVQKPKKYAVYFHNDDFTPMDFVVHVLEKYFQKDADESMAIMLEVHHNEKAIVGVYSKEVADQKVYETMQAAELNGYPLMATFDEYGED